MKLYDVFTRTWWKRDARGKRYPGAGRKTFLARGVTWDEAQAMCQRYNEAHEPGFLSRKAEFMEA